MLYSTSLKLPRLFSLEEGRSQVDINFESINRSIAFILLTGKGELLGNPDFGSKLKLYQFKEITPEVRNILADEIVDSIKQFESRVELDSSNITIQQSGDTVHINISYSLINSNLFGNTTIMVPLPVPTEV